MVFAAEASWRGKLEPLGFEEDLVDLAPPPPPPAPGEPEPDAGQFWKDFVRDTAPEFRKPTIEQLDTFVRPVFEELANGARYCEPQLREIVARARPDVIVQDNVVGFPALLTGGAPYVRIVSCNPLEVKGTGVPPTFSGLPMDDPSAWPDFRAEYDRTHRELWSGVRRLHARAGRAAACPTWSSSTSRSGSTSTSIRRSSTTWPPGRWGRPGTGWSRRCGRPTRRSSCRSGSPTTAARSSTSASARWAVPTSD